MCENGIDYCESNPTSRDTCRACRKAHRRAATMRGEVQPIWIVAYGIEQVYGGPQEGGWWYPWTTIHKVMKAWSVKQALAYVRELRAEYPQPRYNRFSVLGGQDQFVQLYYDPSHFPEETTEREYYE